MKKKIAFVIPSLNPGGAERVISTLANHLQRKYNVYIFTLYKDKQFYDLHKDIVVVSCKESYKANLNFVKSLYNHFYMVTQLYSLFKTHNINLSIGFLTTSNIYTILASKWHNIPCIISERNFPTYSTNSKVWNILRRRLYPMATSIVVQTNAIQSFYSNFIKSQKISVIQNPLSPALTSKRDVNTIKENIILSVGSLELQKNQILLINSFININPKGWKLIIAGEGKLRETYETIITKSPAKDKITLLGNVNNIYNLYNKARIFVLTSNYEGFPNVLIEAMYFGLACVSTNCPSGPSEIITHNKNGFLVPVNNKNELEKKLNELIADSNLQKKIGEKAKESVSYLHVDEIAKKWINLIDDLI